MRRRRLSIQAKKEMARSRAKFASRHSIKKDKMEKYELGLPLKPKKKEIVYDKLRRKVNDKRRRIAKDRGN